MSGKDSVVRRLYSLWYRANRGSKRPLAADLDAYVKEHLEQETKVQYSLPAEGWQPVETGEKTDRPEAGNLPPVRTPDHPSPSNPYATRKPENMDAVFAELDRFTARENKRKLESFSERMLTLMREKGYTEPQVYKAAHVDRKLFSRIASKPDYSLSKNTAVALALGLHLDFDEAQDLIGRAGYSFSRTIKKDVILEYFFRKRYYDIMDINTMLVLFGERTLDGR